MKIKYKSSIDEMVDCHIRLWWMRKSARKSVVINILLIPLVWVFFAYSSDFEPMRTLIKGIVFTIFFGGYLAYAYGPGFRRKTRKRLLESLEGDPFPSEFECEINEDGIRTNNNLHEIKVEWKNIHTVRPYKEYIEIVGKGFLVQIKKEFSPPMDEIVAIWERSKNTSNQSTHSITGSAGSE